MHAIALQEQVRLQAQENDIACRMYKKEQQEALDQCKREISLTAEISLRLVNAEKGQVSAESYCCNSWLDHKSHIHSAYPM